GASMREQESIRAERQELRGYTREVKVYKKTCPVCGREFEGGPRAKYDRQACAVIAYQQHPSDWVKQQRRSRERRKRREKRQGGGGRKPARRSPRARKGAQRHQSD